MHRATYSYKLLIFPIHFLQISYLMEITKAKLTQTVFI